MAAAGIAGILASGCCVGPLLLTAAGFSGAWIGSLAALEPYRPFFVGAALIALVFAWRAIFLRPKTCGIDDGCAAPRAQTVYKVLFWMEAILILLLIAFPYFLPPSD